MKRSTKLSSLHQIGRHRAVSTATAVVVSLAIPLISIGAASATASQWETFHDEGTATYENVCGVAGLTMENSYVADWRAKTTARGRNQLPYYEDFGHSTDTWTNLATSEFVKVRATFHSLDERVTDNGDGTLTKTFNSYGIVTFRDGDGRLIKVLAGRLYGYVELVDHAGTPRDASDDESLAILEDLGGKNTAFCPTLVRAIG